MLFGQKMNKIKNLMLVIAVVGLAYACKQNPADKYNNFISPEGGSNQTSGKDIKVKIQFAKELKVDSVVYLIDSTTVATKKDTTELSLKTDSLKLGNHLLTAKIYAGANPDELTINFTLLAAKAPVAYTYEIINKFPHDTSSYVEGLEYHDGVFYESAGDYGHSSIRKVDPKTGKVLQKTNLEAKYFGEGITIIGNKIIQLTYKEKVGFVYDKATLKKLSEFSYTTGREGWGLAFDGQKVLNTDGSNTIFFLDPNIYTRVGAIDVYDNTGAIENLNELELIDGKIYANVYTTNFIVIINPTTGAVEGKIDLSGLLPKGYFKVQDDADQNVLNGIAYDKATKRLFVTGKKWPTMYEIKLKPVVN